MSGRIPGGSNPYQYGYSSYPDRPSSRQGGSSYSTFSGYGVPQRPGSAMSQRPSSRSGIAASAASANIRPGTGPVNVNGQAVVRTPVSRNGFISAYGSACTAIMSRRDRMPVSSSDKMMVLNRVPAYAAQAHSDRTANLRLSNSPDRLMQLHHATLGYIQSCFNSRQREQIVDALDRYQSGEGDNYLMNANAMGYPSLRHFLQASFQRNISDSDMDNFIHHFNESYSMPELNREEFNAIKTHMENNLAIPTAVLNSTLRHAPGISGITVQKGVYCQDDFHETTMNSNQALRRMLTGDALMFNGFLSTTSSTDAALMFARLGDMGEPNKINNMGNSMYTIDLRHTDASTEVLRRMTLNKLRQDNWAPSHLIFNLTADCAKGIHVDAMDAHNATSISHVGEKEILFAPGHSFQAHKFTFSSDGCVISGTLSYGR